MKILLTVLIALSTASSVYAQHPNWLYEAIRVDNPDELAYWVAVETACPVTEEEVAGVVERVLINSRIKPVKHDILKDDRIYLNVSLRCTEVVADNKHVFGLNIHFGRYKPWPAILFDAPYAAVGLGDTSLVEEKCRERMEEAVSAFRKANSLFIGER